MAEHYERHCPEGDRRGRQYSRRLEQWGRAQVRWLPGDQPYEVTRRQVRIAAETLESLCDHCPSCAGQEPKPCE